MTIRHAVILISIFVISGCKKQETTVYEPISSSDIASVLQMHKFQVKVPDDIDHEAYYQIELVLVQEDKETPLGFKVGFIPDTHPDIIDIILWPSDDPEMYHVKMGGGLSGIRHKIFASPQVEIIPTYNFFDTEVLQIGDFIFKGGDGSMTSTQELQPNEYGVKTRLIKK